MRQIDGSRVIAVNICENLLVILQNFQNTIYIFKKEKILKNSFSLLDVSKTQYNVQLNGRIGYGE